MRRAVIAGCAAFALAISGACADNADNEDVAADAGSAEEYCTMSAELDTLDAPPSEEQLDEIVEVAPAEIKDDVRTLADAIREEDFEAEAAQEADRNLQEWEAENCDRAADTGDGTGEGDGTGDDGSGTQPGDDGTGDGANQGDTDDSTDGTDRPADGGPDQPVDDGGNNNNQGDGQDGNGGGGQDDDTTTTR